MILIGLERYVVGALNLSCATKPSLFHVEVLQGSHDMEDASSSKRAAVVRRDGNRKSIRDGIGMDGERQYQGVHEVEYQCGPVGTCKFFFNLLTFACR